ncbi:ABC transporter ATP-binding protein [Sanguibacter sp. HDW7]|uniref:ABC transporter ATP-binding protein n=1 Tax=Sanguibacter sp. HDW7 TaxID=2714931 RepID=UPI00140D0E12|nr:ATP-binding cassette domain-containing protein [Sanguibacter sp. HDW7]QIK83203.1 ATP-binding cassette domain-containing protein [Sanguibacter sp. HDW7]
MTHLLSWSVAGRRIVDDVSFRAPAGAITGLLGPNGSGKSSLLRLVAGVTRAEAGTTTFDEADLATLGRRERARVAAFVEQDASADRSLTVADAVELGRLPHRGWFAAPSTEDEAAVSTALARAGALDLADRDLGTLSGGERQRAHVARALAQEPRLLLLDEPTNHLDVAAQRELLTLLAGLADDGTTVLTALHDLTLAAAWCDHVVVLDGGRVVAEGPVEEVLVPDVVEAVWGVRPDVLTHPRTGRPLLVL